tara:strand:+ start:7896 stop:8021 length:126 start_codon:yes stop_codon:yes gene_type:complete
MRELALIMSIRNINFILSPYKISVSILLYLSNELALDLKNM